MRRKISRIACVGEVMLELSPTGDGHYRLGVAGDTFNTAVYLRRSLPMDMFDVAYVTALGDDPRSDDVLEALQREHLSIDHVERRAGMSPGLYMISVDGAGERSFSYWRSASAARTLFCDPWAEGLERLSEFDLVYLSGISLAILPPAVRAAVFDWGERFRAGGGTIAFDSNYRPRLWESVLAAREAISAMWSGCDIALPSLDDEMLLFDVASETEVLTRLRAAGATLGALKRGGRGPLALDGSEVDEAAWVDLKVVDATAAGDSFNAGFLAAHVSGQNVPDSIRAGHDLAARVIRHRGAIIPKRH